MGTPSLLLFRTHAIERIERIQRTTTNTLTRQTTQPRGTTLLEPSQTTRPPTHTSIMRPNVMLYSPSTAAPGRLQLVSPTQSPLFCLVLNRAWDDVVRRAKTRPHEVRVQDSATGNTPLHEACRRDPPPHVVRALQSTCRVPNHHGATPLHTAASHRCGVDALRVLLECAALAPPEPSHRRETGAVDDHHGEGDYYEGAVVEHRTEDHHHPRERVDHDLPSSTASEQQHPHHHHPTADLSNMGRAPIHYACMSFRGLEIDAFMLLLDETLKHGNRILDPLVDRDDGHDDLDDLDDFLDDDNDDNNNNNNNEYCDFFEGFHPRPYFEREEEDGTYHHHHRQQPAAVVANVMSMKDALGMTPLALLFRRYRQRVRTVISTVDRLHIQNRTLPSKAALASALTVHVELGELWEKARRIIARLTETRLVREQQLDEHPVTNLTGGGGVEASGTEVYHPQAAEWAAEQHGKGGPASPDDVLPVYVDATQCDAVDGEGSGSPATSSDVETKDGHTKKCRQFRIVHASVGLIGYGCPPEMIRLAISIHPHQVREMDEDGNLPLHIAVRASSYLTSAQQFAIECPSLMGDVAEDDRSVRSSWSFFSTATISQTPHPFDKVIKMLLQHYPEGARTPQGATGQLPLSLAIQSGNRTWDDGIRTLLNAYPPALHSQKVFEPVLYPTVLSALTSCGGGGGPKGSGPASLLHSALCGTTSGLLGGPPSSGGSGGGGGSSRTKQDRHDACARSTLFQVLRTKPEWLTAEGRQATTEIPPPAQQLVLGLDE